MKQVQGVYDAPQPHWVGDGFPVRSIFSYHTHARQLSPFLVLDYAGPTEFAPTNRKLGVGQHPHRGFETVTIVYKGGVTHRDSTGQGGVIGPGDVQWMTAGAGILHEEFHSDAFAQSGGTLEIVQLWVNLRASDKMTAPAYQTILNDDIPTVRLDNDAGTVRVIAGEFGGTHGPARTFSPLYVLDIRLAKGGVHELDMPVGWNTALIVLHGTVQINGDAIARDSQMVLFDKSGEHVSIEANNDAVMLLISGEPIDEPVVGHGPFVMNSQAEIIQALDDFNSGRFGRIPA